jgi:hypothetical protein
MLPWLGDAMIRFPLRRLSLRAAIVAVALVGLPAKADTCFPPFTSLDVIQAVGKDNAQFSHRLKTRIPQALFVTRATLEGKLTEQQLELAFHFRADGTRQPYSIFAVLVVAGGQPLAWHDLTKGCTGLPGFLSPGQSVKIPPVTLPSDPVDLHIVVWGRL